MSKGSTRVTTKNESDLVDRFLELPPIWRLIGAAAMVLVAILVWDEYVRPTADAWNKESDRISSTIERARTLDQRTDPKIERLATALGPIEVPRSAAPGATRLESTVSKICSQYEIVPKIDGRTGSKLPSNSPLSTMAGGRVERIICELEFVSDSETVVEVIRDLEAEPEIESISSLRLKLVDDGPKLEVRIMVEAWIVPRKKT
ncbi:MAG: hypothetical protein O3A19_06110 [Planctomycetota bacterium]|jgi:hypothetical protein|nr:hypothetical protein [Planctomycetota bacterium]MDA1025987.1 hypothetical protein [Planctomycetota bacterium]